MTIRKDLVQLSIEINGVKAGRTTKELKNNARDLRRELDGLAPGTEPFLKKTEELRKVNSVLATIRHETKGVVQGFEEGPRKINPFTDALKKGAAAGLAFFAADRVAGYFKSLFRFFSSSTVELEKMQRKTEIVFGESVDLVKDFAAIHAQSLGVTQEQYAGLAASVGDVLIPMGYYRADAAKTATETVNLAGALAEWDSQNRSIEEITQILTKGVTGEREALKSLGIVIQEVDVKQRLLENGTDKLTGKALQQARATATMQLILEKSRDAQAAFAQNQDQASRSSSRLSGALEEIKETLTRAVLPVWQSVSKAVADSVAPLQKQSDRLKALQYQYQIDIETLKKGNLSREAQKLLLDQVNAKYKDYTDTVFTAKTTQEEYNKALEKGNQEFERQILAISFREVAQEATNARTRAIVESKEIARAITDLETQIENFSFASEATSRQGASTEINSLRLNLRKLEDDFRKNGEQIEKYEIQLKDIKAAAADAKIDLADIFSGGGTGTGTGTGLDPTAAARRFEREKELIEQTRQLRIAALDRVELTEQEYTFRRKVINLEADNEIAAAQIRILEGTKSEKLKLEQDIADRKAEIQETAAKFNLEQTRALIAAERQLAIKALDEEGLNARERTEQIALITLDSQRREIEARIDAARAAGTDITALENELAEKRAEIVLKGLELTAGATLEQINIERELSIQALDALLLSEEEYNQAKETINNQADIRIMEFRLSTMEKGTAEFIRLENEIAAARCRINSSAGGFRVDSSFASSGGFSSQDERDSELSRRAEIEAAGFEISRSFLNAAHDLKLSNIENALSAELTAIDEIEKRKLESAGDDQELQKKIRLEAERDRASAEKRAARERKSTARKEAVIQGALAVVEALPNPVLAAIAAAASAAQIAVIDSQKFYRGGHTGSRAIYRDSEGHDVAGVVHVNEWVAPSDMVSDPHTGPVIRRLESIRQKRGGYADGGFAGIDTSPVGFTSSAGTAVMSSDRALVDAINEMRAELRAWPERLRVYLPYTDIEGVKAEIDYIRDQAAV